MMMIFFGTNISEELETLNVMHIGRSISVKTK